MGVNQRLFIFRALNIYCLVTLDKTKERKEERAVQSYLIAHVIPLGSFTNDCCLLLIGLGPHSESSDLKFGLKELAKSGTLMVQN